MVKRSWLAAGLCAVGFFAAGNARSAPSYCPTASQGACGARQVGDILIGLHYSGRVLGLNPSTGAFYMHSTALTFSTVELGDIAVLPSNPMKLVAIGNVDSGIGIRQLDSCGNLTLATYGPFPETLGPPPLPPFSKGGTTNRGVVFNPLSGKLYAPGRSSSLIGDTNNYNFLYTFPPSGGALTVELARIPSGTELIDPGQLGLAAADEFGSLYVGYGTRVLTIPGGGLARGEPAVSEYSITSGALGSIADIVHDGNNHLFVSGTENGQGRIWRVSTLTGVTQTWAWDRGPSYGYEPYNGFKGLTIDAQGNLWAIETFSSANNRVGIAKISKDDGSLLQYFTLPSTVGGAPAAGHDPFSLAVLGVSLPAVREACSSDCGQGEITDCYGACMPADFVGDAFCDEGPHQSLACWGRSLDQDDCNYCAAAEVPDCNGHCAPKAWLGDDICDAGGWWYGGNAISFECPEFRFDEVTCLGCGWGEKLDCNGNCSPDGWFGDGVCDDGSYSYLGHPVDYRCVEYDFDSNDCPVGG